MGFIRRAVASRAAGIIGRRPGGVLIAGTALALTAALAPHPATAPAAASPAPAPVRILVVGDSITTGMTGSATYRYWVYREFLRQGVPVQFVGNRTELAFGTYYEHRNLGFAQQTHHGAKQSTGFAWHNERIANQIRKHDADVVLAQIGFNNSNEVENPKASRNVADMAMTFTHLVLGADPDVRLVLGELPNTDRHPRKRPGFAAKKNRVLVEADRLINERVAALGSPRVFRNHLRSHPQYPYDSRIHTYDGSHANSTGETVMAQHFAEALHEMGVLPQMPKVMHKEPWQPRPRFTWAQPKPRGVSLHWYKDRQRVRAKRYHARVWYRGGFRTFWPRPTRKDPILMRLPPGRYAVRMIAHHGTMTSKPGPRRWVRVRHH